MSTSVDSLGSLTRLQSVFPSGSGSDYDKSPREDDFCLQPLELAGSTDDDVECGSCISAYSRLSIREMSDLVLAADLSSSEFADSTPIDSDRSERQTNLKSFLERSHTETPGDLPRLSSIRCQSSPSTSPPNSPPPTVAPRLPSTLLYTKSLRPHRIKTTLPLYRRERALKLVVSIPFHKLSDSQISRYYVKGVKSTDHAIKEPTKKVYRQKYKKQNRSRAERKRSISPLLSDVVIAVPPIESLPYEKNMLEQEIDITLCSNVSWETANSDVMFSTPVSSVCSSVTEHQQQPYVVTLECSSADEFPSKRINRGTNSIDKIATFVGNSMKNSSLDTTSLSSTNQDQNTSSTSLMDTVESLHNSLNHSTLHATSSFSFEGIFSFYPPDLTIVDGELAPAYTLSLKDSNTVPFNHPIYNWSFGRRVDNGQTSVRKRKRSPQKIIR